MRSRALLIVLSLPGMVTVGCAAQAHEPWHVTVEPVPTGFDRAKLELNEPIVEFPSTSFSRPLSREAAFQILLSTQVFADAYIGQGGERSLQVEAFQVVLRQPDAIDAFADLLARGRTAGKLYALCGLRLLAPRRYARAERSLLASDVAVHGIFGCVRGHWSVRDIIRSGGPSSYDIAKGAMPRRFRDAQ